MLPYIMISRGVRPKIFVQGFRRSETGSREEEAQRLWRGFGACGAVAAATATVYQSGRVFARDRVGLGAGGPSMKSARSAALRCASICLGGQLF